MDLGVRAGGGSFFCCRCAHMVNALALQKELQVGGRKPSIKRSFTRLTGLTNFTHCNTKPSCKSHKRGRHRSCISARLGSRVSPGSIIRVFCAVAFCEGERRGRRRFRQ